MPADTMLIASAVIGFFAVFAAVLLFTDLTWRSTEE
jgi:hypothetical protein